MSPATEIVHGKCILLGEHAVVRGRRALVAPLLSRSLSLSFTPPPDAREAAGWRTTGPLAEPTRLCLAATEKEGGVAVPPGTYHVTSDIPARAGLGSSAALSVALCRFLLARGALSGEVFPHALRLENIFHGQSSGIDIAAVSAGTPITFRRGEPPRPLTLGWNPRWHLSDTGLRSSTKACVEKVAALPRSDLDALDDRMDHAAAAATAALAGPGSPASMAALVRAIEEGAEIFRAWNLVPPAVADTITRAYTDGARAAKPTGSGDGGFVLSLWDRDPPAHYLPVG